MTPQIDYAEYERRKQAIITQNLSPEEHERAIRQMVEDLDSESDVAAA
jgi:uncharacterized protein (DUF2384 family)